MPEKPRIFISYSHKDESFKDELIEHLSGFKHSNLIDTWEDRMIMPGEEWDEEIKAALMNSNIILFLVSASFMHSNYIRDVEIKKAIERHNNKEVTIVPIIIRPYDFQSLELSKFQTLPKDAKPITKWEDRDEGWLNVINGLKRLLVKKKVDRTNQENSFQREKSKENKKNNLDLKKTSSHISNTASITGNGNIVNQSNNINYNPKISKHSIDNNLIEKVQLIISELSSRDDKNMSDVKKGIFKRKLNTLLAYLEEGDWENIKEQGLKPVRDLIDSEKSSNLKIRFKNLEELINQITE